MCAKDMMCTILICVAQSLFLTLVQFSDCILGQQTRLFNVEASKKYLSTFKTVQVDSTMKCSAACGMEATCRAISYEGTSGTCELNDRNPPLDQYASSTSIDGWVSFYTDLAPCYAGWTQYYSSCYQAVTTTRTWANSESHCQGLGGHLVDIQDGNELQFVERLSSGLHPWIGLNDHDQEGTFTWSSTASYSYNAFHPVEPNGGTGENCIRMSALLWYDYSCSITFNSVCEKGLY